MARLCWKPIAVVLAGACVCCIACSNGTGPGTDTVIDASRSTLTVAPSVAMGDTTAVTGVTVQARNAAGEPLAGVAVQLTASGAAIPATLAPASGTTDATGSFSATLTAVTWGKVTVTAALGATSATVSADVDVTCASTAMGVWGPWSTLSPVRARAVADGKSPVRLLAGAAGLMPYATRPVPIGNTCVRVSTDRSEVVVRPATGRTSSKGDPVAVEITADRPGTALVTAETPLGSTSVTIEFVTAPAWSLAGAPGTSAPLDAYAVVTLPRRAELVAFGDGRFWWSSDAGTTWNPVDGPTRSAASADLVASPSVPDLIVARVGSDVFRSTDAGRTFSVVPSLTADALRVHPTSGEWVAYTNDGPAAQSDPTTQTWSAVAPPFPSTWSTASPTIRYVPSSDPGAWLAFAWPRSTGGYFGGIAYSPTATLWRRGAEGSWTDVTGTLFASEFGHYENAWWTGDLDGDIEDPTSAYLVLRGDIHCGPGCYTSHDSAWHSTDGGVSWAPYPIWSGLLHACGSTGVFHVDANGVVWKHTESGFLDASVGLPDGVRSLACVPSTPGTVYAATPSGVFVTTTGGE